MIKFKIDENFGKSIQEIFLKEGYDVHTIYGEGLQGADDNKIYNICCKEQRCLITLDLDFSDIVRFPPNKTGGIAVIRTPKNSSFTLLKKMIKQFIKMLNKMSVKKKLWIVEIGRIRVHQSEEEED